MKLLTFVRLDKSTLFKCENGFPPEETQQVPRTGGTQILTDLNRLFGKSAGVM